MELDVLKKFIQFMDDNNLCELEIEEKGSRIRLKKTGATGAVAVPLPAAIAQSRPQEAATENHVEIKSPMVGTFYRAPSPGAKPYVEVGEMIKPGDVVCIVEAMKLMNEIKAEVAGKVVRIPVENGQPVEFGQNLLIIEPV